MGELTKYPRIVNERVAVIIETLREDGFFIEFNITEDYAVSHFSELVVDKYLTDPSLSDFDMWGDEEFMEILTKVIIGSVLNELKDEGVLSSYEDENTEETFFLTEKGKLLTEGLKNQN
jgi:hypothetical protein